VNESTTLAVWRLVSSGGIFETLDDGLACISSNVLEHRRMISSHSFARTIHANDQGQRGVELDCFAAGVVEGANAQHGQLVDER